MLKNYRMWRYVREVTKRIAEDEYQSTFTSWQIIDNSGYVDFLFIGTHNEKPVVWNACMSTAKGDYYEKAHGMALDEAYEKFPSNRDWRDCFVKIPGTKYSKFIDPEPELSKARHNFMAQRTMELINSGTVNIVPWNIEIDESYKYGIGLHIRVGLDSINIADIEDFISNFNKYGTKVFMDKDVTPISLTAEELGVELKEGDQFVSWKNCEFSHNTTAIKGEFFT